jgi:PBSX family phage terminase large subunit
MDVLVPNLKPSPKQTLFLSSEADETFYGGAAGGGKSAALCDEAITSCLEDEGHHTYIFRRTIKELKQSVLPELYKQLGPYPFKYNSQDSTFTFSNNSIIQLAYLDNEADKYRYQSAEIHTLLFDELTHFTQDQYEYLKTRVRSEKPRLMRIMGASNPGNVGHGWVKAYFIDGHTPETIFKDVTGVTKMFIPATVSDHPNPVFRESYTKQLEALSDESLKRALLHGDWDIFSGQVFTEWRRTKHVFSELPVNLNDCKLYCGLDWGYNDNTAIYWVAQAPENEAGRFYYVYRELYGNQTRPEDWAYKLAEYFKSEPVQFLAMPHDTFSNLGGTMPIVQQFRDVFDKLGVRTPIVKAPSGTHQHKINRQALLHQLLSDSTLGKPYLQVSESCVNLIRTLPMLVYSDLRPEELADQQEDHAYDGLTYILYSIASNNFSAIVTPKQPGQKPKAPYVDEDGNLVGAGLDEMMANAVKKTLQPRGRDWIYRP